MSTHINVCFSEIFILRIIKITMYWQIDITIILTSSIDEFKKKKKTKP